MQAPVDEILPSFKSVREKGLNLIDASQLHHIGTRIDIAPDGITAAAP
jgi:hypothetical protein